MKLFDLHSTPFNFQAGGVLALANSAVLLAFDDRGVENGGIVYVETYRSYFQKILASPAPAQVADLIFPTATGDGGWYRLDVKSQTWRSQADWYIDPIHGGDQQSGAVGQPLASWAEFERRVSSLAVSMTVTFLSDYALPVLGDFHALAAGLTLIIQGTPVVVASTGAVTTYTDPIRTLGACAQGTMTSGIADFTAHVGLFLRTSTDYYAPILGVDAGHKPVLPLWANASLSNTKPNANVAADVVAMTSVDTMQIGLHGGLAAVVKYLKFTNTTFAQSVCLSSDNTATIGHFLACDFAGSLTVPGDAYFIACQLSGSGDVYAYNPANFVGGGARRTVAVYGIMSFQGFIIQGGAGLVVGNAAGYAFASLSTVLLVGAAAGLGVFASSGVGVTLGGGAFVNGTTLYGAANATYGLTANYGARMQISVDPTITGTTADLQFCGAATAIAPLTAGAVVPAAAALTTWGNWAAGPFSKKLINYSNLTSICL